MQVSLMGSLQRGQGIIPVSARLKSTSECVVGIVLSPSWAGALPISQSPMDAEGGAVMASACASSSAAAGQYCSYRRIVNNQIRRCARRWRWWPGGVMPFRRKPAGGIGEGRALDADARSRRGDDAWRQDKKRRSVPSERDRWCADPVNEKL